MFPIVPHEKTEGTRRVRGGAPRKRPRRSSYAPWTPAEDAILEAHYPELGATKLAPRFPGRTVEALRSRAQVLQLEKSARWLAVEDAYLLAHYEIDGPTAVSVRLGRTYKATCLRARKRFGLRAPVRRPSA